MHVSGLRQRVAGAPITWGVDGSPGWGYLMDRDRVLSEMVDLGLTATELGPDGYLPREPAELHDYLRSYSMRVVAGFVPAMLHRSDQVDDEFAYVDRAARQLASTGAAVLVLGPASHSPGYETSIEMSDDEWRVFLENLNRLMGQVAQHGLTTALHPHWGMAIEKPDHVARLLDSSEVAICLDTGHLYLGGGDPAETAKLAGGRVAHVHLKDVDGALANRVRAGETGFKQAVIEGLFRPLGDGDVDIAGVINQLESTGFGGWYVLEQDAALSAEPAIGEGPKADAAKSLAFLDRVGQGL
jgi:inosose dehydratase